MAYTTTVFNIRYRITLIVSLYRNWYLHSTINKVYLLEYTGNQKKSVIVYNIQTYNLLVYTNATGNCFCFYCIHVKNYGHAECTKFKFEMEQPIINANMEIKDRTSDNRKSIKQTRVKQVPG
jgi:hypothetical protein